MEVSQEFFSGVIEAGGIFAPILFILIHLLRPILFLPVILFCIIGGLMFGVIAGSIYSIIGITLSSLVFYFLLKRAPGILNRILQVKDKVIGDNVITSKSQIMLLRLIPFIHFNLLSLCLIELTVNVKDYLKSSFYTSIPFTIVYTSIGQWMLNLSPTHILLFFVGIIPFLYLFRKKQFIIKWNDFFHAKA